MKNAAKLRKAIDSVLYELWVLRTSGPPVWEEDLIESNRRVETMVLHARVLRDFFFVNPNLPVNATDIVATDFFANAKKDWPHTRGNLSPYLAKNKTRMDRALAHLSYDREKWTGRDKIWDSAPIFAEIGDKWFEFLDRLSASNEPAFAWIQSHTNTAMGRVPLRPPFEDPSGEESEVESSSSM